MSGLWVARQTGKGVVVEQVKITHEDDRFYAINHKHCGFTWLRKSLLGENAWGCYFGETREQCINSWNRAKDEEIRALEDKIKMIRKRKIV